MMRHARSVMVCLFGTIAMAGLTVSTTSDLRELTWIQVPNVLQIPGAIAIGMLCAFALRSAAAATVALVAIAAGGALLHGLAIALAAFEVEAASVFLINRATVQGFYALIVIFCFGMAGIVTALLINVFVRRLDI